MLPHILPNLPEHKAYTEAFCGGAAVFFAKSIAQLEVLNDVNSNLVCFYRMMRLRFSELRALIRATPHSRSQKAKAWDIYRNAASPQKGGPSELERAWAVWCLSAQGFAGRLDSSWGYSKKAGATLVPHTLSRRRDRFSIELQKRLAKVSIECRDALHVLKTYDGPDTLHYIDPPYINTECAHYAGYTEADYAQLLALLPTLTGHFLLSGYDNVLLCEAVQKHGWHQLRITRQVAVSGLAKGSRTEVLTANYPLVGRL